MPIKQRKPISNRPRPGQPQIEQPRIPNAKSVHLVRGMRDTLPDDEKYWRHIQTTIQGLMDSSYFSRIETPIVESTTLFTRAIGENTDIVEKEMFTFADRGGDNVTLRPEGTSGVVRAYIEHGFLNLPQPVKLWYFGPFFRYDRPQAGRYRQLHQWGAEVIGDGHPVIDAQLIGLALAFFKALHLPVSIQINSVGDKESRVQYNKVLWDFLKSQKSRIPKETLDFYKKNPMRILDVKDEELQGILANAPQLIDYLTKPSHDHFVKVLEHLDELEVPYVLNPKIVRGLDYYTHTTFEIFPDSATSEKLNALGGGGRYDKLVELFGGRENTPACGFGIGIDRVVNYMKSQNVVVPEREVPQVFLAQLGDLARKKAIALFHTLREAGFRVAESFSKEGLKSQMEIANRLKVAYTLIIGQKEIIDDTILIRDMENGIQEVVDWKKIVPELQKRMDATNGNGNHANGS